MYRAAPYHRIPAIKRPTLFLNSLDDPFIASTLDRQVFKNNPHVILATNQFAGHLGYHESLFQLDQWFAKPVIDFLDALEADKDKPSIMLANDLIKQNMPDPADATAELKRRVEQAAEELQLLEQMNRVGKLVPKAQEQLVNAIDKERVVMIN